MKSFGATAFQLSFQCSPIVLTNGIAQLIPGGMLPIISITESLNFVEGLLGGGDAKNPDQFFAHFKPMPGASLIANQYGKYPFANQTVAANAVIGEPLKVALLMTLQVKDVGARLATMTALQATLQLHSNLGGSYTVITPSFLYTNMLLDDLVCTGDTNAGAAGVQSLWQWTFEQPLLTEQAAITAYNGMLSNISGGLPSTGALSGSEVVQSPSSLATSSVSPAASSLTGSSVAGFIPS